MLGEILKENQKRFTGQETNNFSMLCISSMSEMRLEGSCCKACCREEKTMFFRAFVVKYVVKCLRTLRIQHSMIKSYYPSYLL